LQWFEALKTFIAKYHFYGIQKHGGCGTFYRTLLVSPALKAPVMMLEMYRPFVTKRKGTEAVDLLLFHIFMIN
jgi:hypothetical protein